MRVSRESLSCWVVGESWKRPYAGRTLSSLQRAGFDAEATNYWELKTVRPPSYSDLIRDALERTGPERHALIVPAGLVASDGFAKELDRYLEAVRPQDAMQVRLASIPESPRGARLAEGIALGQSTTRFSKIDSPPGFLTARFPRAMEKTTPVPIGNGMIPRYRIEQGRETFQDLERDVERIALERPLEPLSPQELRSVKPGWVFQCNNEGVSEGVSEALGCDTLVAVASGIKPWHFANELRRSLKHLILLDASLPQLRYASEAFEAIGEAPSWTAICQLPGYTSMPDKSSLARHDELYKAVRAGRRKWRFETIFLPCDLLTQTFRLVEFLKTYSPRKAAFWYSNVFHPFFGQRFSEDHRQVEMSFVQLMQREFPGILLYNSHREPVLRACSRSFMQ